MTLGALVDTGVDFDAIRAGVDSLGLPGCRLSASEVKRKGFRGIHVVVEHEPEHKHRHLHHIVELIDRSRCSPRQQELAKRIFTRLAEAEAKVHATTVAKVHFHEVGAVDSIADIVGAAIGWDLLGAERIVASPVPTGRGTIEIAHGRTSIPAPATAELLAGIPLAESKVDAELTTPTGAAILATLVDDFGPLPAMKIERIGYGAGTRDLPDQANLLRLFVGESANELKSDQVWIVETNLDDVSGEVIGYAMSRLWEAGAVDVYTTAVQMKKNRPGVVVTALCPAERLLEVEQVLLSETGTLGVRRWPASRSKLERHEHRVRTPWGVIVGKLGMPSGQTSSFSPEYEDCRRVAAEHRVPLRVVYEAALVAFAAERSSG